MLWAGANEKLLLFIKSLERLNADTNGDIGYNPGYKRGRRFSSLEFQRLYDSDFFESHL